jgi:hypothetical protein
VSCIVRALSDAFAEGQCLADDERDRPQHVIEVGRIELAPVVGDVGAELPPGFGSVTAHILSLGPAQGARGPGG